MTMQMFAQLTKVDEAKRLVYGRAAQEVPDRADEIFDYASSKPYFVEWSKAFAEDTGGKSLGNLRAMHGKVAAGKLTEIVFNDDAKAIDIAAKIVDDGEWKKVLEGVYTGFSIGGSYVGDKITEKIDDREVKRYTAQPAEVSIVDSPCIPTAKFFEVVKADGAVSKVEFRPSSIELEVTGTDEEVAQFAQALNASKLSMKDAIALVQGEATKRAQDAMLETVESLAKREFSTDERKQAAKEGQAMPDGSFPIKTVADLENAVHAWGRARDKEAVKAHIIKRAKALGATDKLPEGWIDGGKSDGKAAQAGDLKKGMWNVQAFAQCLDSLASVARNAQYDLEVEGDNSPVPMQLRNAFGELVATFKAMAAEEADECLASVKDAAGVGEDDDIDDMVEQALRVGALRKRFADPELSLADLMKIAGEHLDAGACAKLKTPEAVREAVLAKVGARHSAADKAHLQAAHDHLVAMGAACDDGKAAPAGELVKATETIKRLEADVAKLLAQPMPHPLVKLRTVRREDDGPAAARDEADLDDVRLERADYIYNADGTVDWATSRFVKSQKASAQA